MTALIAVMLCGAMLSGCVSGSGARRGGTGSLPIYQTGAAIFYAARFRGRRTASGERYRTRKLTAAHRDLPFGSRVLVTNRENGRSVTVRINDRGPYSDGRIIDLSRRAARVLRMRAHGVVPVSLRIVSRPD